ncbi:hypothetical protein APA_138 [Pseudanabaena sp. lw0831]|nr:hypothetical protein APA_138 [Pseudanabaena sp. lw0831]
MILKRNDDFMLVLAVILYKFMEICYHSCKSLVVSDRIFIREHYHQ